MSTAPRTRSGRAATADTHLGQCSGMTPEKEQGWIVSVDLGTPDPEPEFGFDGVTYRWRGQLTDAEMVGLVRAHGGQAVKGWWNQMRAHSLGWVTAWASDGGVIGFVNVTWDGRDHAFLLDTKTHSLFQRKGIGTRLVELAVKHAKAAGCEWLRELRIGTGALLLTRAGSGQRPPGSSICLHIAIRRSGAPAWASVRNVPRVSRGRARPLAGVDDPTKTRARVVRRRL